MRHALLASLVLAGATAAQTPPPPANPAQGQQRQGAQAGQPGRGVLGGVPMTAADSMVQRVVARLDFN
ncbi:MAG: hypothetical protein JNJ98_20390, partial [Gemmatimonadetes bacterium]|nr:hypothetical protein [Gemmatimonadota bacterium]